MIHILRMCHCLLAPVLLLCWLASLSFAYVPAHPTNSSQEAIEGGLNVTDISKLHLRWFSNGSYSQNVSYQLVGKESNGISKGALVHFSETRVNNATPGTTTPWIAMVSCDFNATDASQEIDIFTLARDKGAVGAVLYSFYSAACVINPEYADPQNFDQVFDIFSTQSLTSAHLIEYQFGQSSPENYSTYAVYDSARLNDSFGIINATITEGYPPAPGYLFGILQSYNATAGIDDASSNNTGHSENPPSGSSSNTALAMIVLYAITGCVSALFCIVIVSGAIRAIRHPERYGPRARNGNDDEGQSRARGLTRAILDTFPIVKFGSSQTEQNGQPSPTSTKDVEAQSVVADDVELKEWQTTVAQDSSPHAPPRNQEDVNEKQIAETNIPTNPVLSIRPSQSYSPVSDTSPDNGEGSSKSANSPRKDREDILPAAIGHETCPICIMDFEEGDDLRVLPCEGQHRFHQQCVDPWLLELSSSCPICRQDFLALENILSGESQTRYDDEEYDYPRPQTQYSVQGNRFSRYLRFATRRRHHNQEEGGDSMEPHTPI